MPEQSRHTKIDGDAGASTVEEGLPASGWPDGYVHVYLPGLSTRGVELYREDEDLAVRLLTCSAPVEYALGVSMATAAAELCRTDVRSEDGEVLAPAHLASRYGPDWIDGNVRSGARVTLLLADERGPLAMSGPVRDFHLGPRLADDLRAAGTEAALADRLLAAMRRTQWPGGAYYGASRFRVTGRQTEAKLTFAVWSGTACVVPDVELVMLHGPGGEEPLPVPRESVPAFAGDRWAWLDERQLLLEPVSDEHWPAMRAAAEPYRVELPQ